VPFVWHYKEGPWFSRQHGHWPQLAELHLRADGVVYSSPELRDWFAVTLPGTAGRPSHVLDGDLPKAEWLVGEQSPLLSEQDGDVHTVIAGRPLGPPPEVVGELARAGVHVHVYSEKVHAQMRDWVEACRRLAPDHLHLHAQVDQADWVRVFSQYDAGWLHDIRAATRGPARRHLGRPELPGPHGDARAAGVPMLQRDNAGHVVATQALCRERELGLLWREPADLVDALTDRERMSLLRKSVWSQREHFTFDAHVDELVGFFRARIAERRRAEAGAAGRSGQRVSSSSWARRGAADAAPLEVEQEALAVQAAGVAGEAAVGADDAVARHDEAVRVAPVGRADGAHRGGAADRGGERAVRRRRAVRAPRAGPPTPRLERRAERASATSKAAAARRGRRRAAPAAPAGSRRRARRGGRRAAGGAARAGTARRARPSCATTVIGPSGPSTTAWVRVVTGAPRSGQRGGRSTGRWLTAWSPTAHRCWTAYAR
jgi:hypothetical protein